MIAEEEFLNEKVKPPEITISNKSLSYCIINLFKQATPLFKLQITTYLANKVLNEDELTQVFVSQLIILSKKDYPFGINSQYRDSYHGSTGFSDFYFFPTEEGKSTESIFSVESKRLPAPTKDREEEYVKGKSKSGGIERYKIEKHGKELAECGILGFIEKENPPFWLNTINQWIENLSNSDATWNKDEKLNEVEKDEEFTYLNSVAHTVKSRNILLHHFWIETPTAI